MLRKAALSYLTLVPLLSVFGSACLLSIIEARLKKLHLYLPILTRSALVTSFITATYLLFQLKDGLALNYWQGMLYWDRSTSFFVMLICVLAWGELRRLISLKSSPHLTYSTLLFTVGGLIITFSSRELISFCFGSGAAFWSLISFLKTQLNLNDVKTDKSLTNLARLEIVLASCLLYGSVLTLLVKRTTTIYQLFLSAEPLSILALGLVFIGLSGKLLVSYFLMHLISLKTVNLIYKMEFINIGFILSIALFTMRFGNICLKSVT